MHRDHAGIHERSDSRRHERNAAGSQASLENRSAYKKDGEDASTKAAEGAPGVRHAFRRAATAAPSLTPLGASASRSGELFQNQQDKVASACTQPDDSEQDSNDESVASRAGVHRAPDGAGR